MGELHLEIIVDRLLREFKVEANVGAPQVAYRETIRKDANQETKYARQSGVRASMVTLRSRLSPTRVRVMSSSTVLLAALSRRNTSPLLTTVSRAR